VDDAKWERFGAIGGFVFVVLALVGALVAGAPPQTSDSAHKIAKYFSDHDRAIRTGSFLSVIGTLFLLWWVGSLWTRLRRAEGGAPRLTVVAALGTVLGAAGALASFATTSAIDFRLAQLGPNGAKVFYTLSVTALSAGAVGLAALVLATSVITIRTRVFPVWVAYGGYALGLLWLVAVLGVASERGVFFGLLFAAFLVWLAWIAVLSVLMLRAGESERR
jgi:hypothetical protein